MESLDQTEDPTHPPPLVTQHRGDRRAHRDARGGLRQPTESVRSTEHTTVTLRHGFERAAERVRGGMLERGPDGDRRTMGRRRR